MFMFCYLNSALGLPQNLCEIRDPKFEHSLLQMGKSVAEELGWGPRQMCMGWLTLETSIGRDRNGGWDSK